MDSDIKRDVTNLDEKKQGKLSKLQPFIIYVMVKWHPQNFEDGWKVFFPMGTPKQLCETWYSSIGNACAFVPTWDTWKWHGIESSMNKVTLDILYIYYP